MHRVNAIRDHKMVGRGSCTSIDECFSNEELYDCLDDSGVKTEEDAVKWALNHEGLFLEKGLNQRWGEDDDPQLKQWNDWQEKLKEEV